MPESLDELEQQRSSIFEEIGVSQMLRRAIRSVNRKARIQRGCSVFAAKTESLRRHALRSAAAKPRLRPSHSSCAAQSPLKLELLRETISACTVET